MAASFNRNNPLNLNQLAKTHTRFCDNMRVRAIQAKNRIENGHQICVVFEDLYFQLATDLSRAILKAAKQADVAGEVPRFFDLEEHPVIKIEDDGETEIPLNLTDFEMIQPPNLQAEQQSNRQGQAESSGIDQSCTLPFKKRKLREDQAATSNDNVEVFGNALQCSVQNCDRIFSNKRGLSNHIRYHKNSSAKKITAVVDCPSPECTYSSTSKGVITKHVKKYHPEVFKK